jgi:hypothetical protein
MALFYQRKTLVPLANVGPVAQLPANILGLADSSLANLPLAIGTPAATELGYLNTGFFPDVPPIVNPTVGNGAFRVALRRAGLQANFQSGVNSLGNEFKDWYDNQPTFTVGDGFVTAVVAAAGGALPAQIAAIFVVAAGLTQPA